MTSDKITIVWAHDYRLSERLGGAQLTNKEMIKNAPDWCTVLEVYPDMLDHFRFVEGDRVLVILNNMREFNSAQLAKLTKVPFMIYAHDFWQCKERWQTRLFSKLICDAAGFVFLSPLHKTKFEHRWQTGKIQGLVCPPPFDLDKYHSDWHKEFEGDGFVYLGEFGQHKGITVMDTWAKGQDIKIDCYGWGDLSEYLHLVDCGQLAHEDVPDFLARRCGAFVFLPMDVEPFGRVSAEAILSGCMPVFNENVGSLSYGWGTLDMWKKELAEAPEMFWSYVHQVCDGVCNG